MNILKAVVIIGLTCSLAGGNPVQGGEKKERPNREAGESSTGVSAGKKSYELLKGVIHFSDDDVRFRTAAGIRVFVDPVSWPTDELVKKSGMTVPDLILITHSHEDHFQPTMVQEYLSLNPKAIVAGPPDVAKVCKEMGVNVKEVVPGRTYAIAGITLSTVPSCFLEGESHPKAKQWVGYVLQLDGASYYVTGDTQPLPEMGQLKVDVLFPLLSGCGGNLEQALKMEELCKAPVVVPVHTNGREEVIKRFLAQLPKGVQGGYYKDATFVPVR
jgi:L-ascorbate metabolism protein UlaG (beta-lactamase superfamily)